jgi:heat shock protein HslJ
MKTRIILSALLAVLVVSFSHAKGSKTLYVADRTVACAGTFECIQIREKTSAPWRNYSDTIVGFNYEEGYEYKISVQPLQTLNTLSGIYEEKYKLLKVVSKKKTGYKPADKLSGKRWIMKSMYDTKKTLSVPDTSGIYMIFDVKNGTASGKAICNTFHTSYSCKDSTISFPNFASTKMMCKGQAFEGVVLNFIKNATTFKLQGEVLILTQPNGSNIVFLAR